MVHIGDTEKRYDPKVIRPLLRCSSRATSSRTTSPQPGRRARRQRQAGAGGREAVDRGVWFDTAHGRMNFSFDVGRRCIEQGLMPHCISTDLTVPGRVMTVHSMTEMMTRFLGLGFTLPQVVTMSRRTRPRPSARRRASAAWRWAGRPTSRCSTSGRRLGGLRHPGIGPAREPRVHPAPDGEAGPRVHAGLRARARGAGCRIARSREAAARVRDRHERRDSLAA